MSPSSLPVVLLLLLWFVEPSSMGPASISRDMECCAQLDANQLQDYVTSLNVSEISDKLDNLNETLSLELPFGALASDWSRLLLLQDRQPEGTLLREHLLRLSRLVLAAYFAAQDSQEMVVQDSHDDIHGEKEAVKNQQAADVKLESTGQEASSRINNSPAASPPHDNDADKKVEPRSEKSAGNETDSRIAGSHNDAGSSSSFLLSALDSSRTHLNRSADNETDGSSKSNGDYNKDETGSSRDVLSRSGEARVTSESSKDEDNEAIHQVSKEKFTTLLLESKKNGSDNRVKSANETSDVLLPTDDDDSTMAGLNSTKSLEPYSPSVENFSARQNAPDSEELLLPLTKSVEEFFASSEEQEANVTKSVEDFFASSEEQEANVTKSVEDFFASSEEMNVTKSMEEFFAASQEANVTENDDSFAWPSSEERNVTQSVEEFFNQESDELAKSNETFPSSSSSEDSDNNTTPVSAETIAPGNSAGLISSSEVAGAKSIIGTKTLLQLVSSRSQTQLSEILQANGTEDLSSNDTTGIQGADRRNIQTSDDLFRDEETTTMAASLQDDWDSQVSTAPARNIVMKVLHSKGTAGVMASSQKLSKVELNFSTNDDTRESNEEDEGLNPASLRNQQQDWNDGIAGGAQMNKRKRGELESRGNIEPPPALSPDKRNLPKKAERTDQQQRNLSIEIRGISSSEGK